MTNPSGPIAIICGYDADGIVKPCLIDADGALVTAGGTTEVDASDVTYTPTTVADWDGGVDPGNQDSANDQLAERVKDLETDTVDTLLPTRDEWFHDCNSVVTGNALAVLLNAAQFCNGYWFQNAPANNDVTTHSSVLKAGAYTLRIIALKYVNGGKLDVAFKHISDAGYTSIIAGSDLYAAASTYNTIVTGTFTVTIPGRHIFKFTANGKNAASGGYGIVITKSNIYLTAGDS